MSVQTFVGENSAEKSTTPNSQRVSNSSKSDVLRVVGTADSFSLLVNEVKCQIGSGILSLPCAIASFGYVLGVIMLIVAAFTSYIGLHFIAEIATRIGRNATPSNVAARTYPRTWIIMDGAIVLSCFGSLIAYLLLIGMTLSVFATSTLEIDALSVWSSPRLWITFMMIIIIPLSFLKSMNNLKYTSLLGLASILYLTVLSVVSLLTNPASTQNHIEMFAPFSFGSIGKFGVILFAFTCHQSVMPLFNEAKNNSVGNLSLVSAAGTFISLILYIIYGIASYLNFPEVYQSDSMFDCYLTLPHFQIARLLFAFVLAFTYPLQLVPLRASLYRFMGMSPSLSPQSKKGFRFFLCTTIGILLASYGVAMIQPQLMNILCLVGAATSPIFVFIMPALYYRKMVEKESKTHTFSRHLALFLMIFGIAILILCTTASILNFF